MCSFDRYSYFDILKPDNTHSATPAPIINNNAAIDNRSSISPSFALPIASTMRFGTGDRINSDTAPAILAACFSVSAI